MKSIAIVLIAIVVIMGFTAITTAHPAFALSRFFNCMTEIANSHGHLTVHDVNNCYHKEFHSA